MAAVSLVPAVVRLLRQSLEAAVHELTTVHAMRGGAWKADEGRQYAETSRVRTPALAARGRVPTH